MIAGGVRTGHDAGDLGGELLEARGRLRGVERHVDAAGHHHAERGDRELGPGRDRDADRCARCDGEAARELAGAAGELAAREIGDDGDGVRIARELLGDERVHGGVRQRHVGRVPRRHDELALGGRHHRQLRQRQVRRGGRGGEQRREALHHALRGRLGEQVRADADHQIEDAAGTRGRADHHVARLRGVRERVDREAEVAATRELGARHHVDDHVEQRLAAGGSRGRPSAATMRS